MFVENIPPPPPVPCRIALLTHSRASRLISPGRHTKTKSIERKNENTLHYTRRMNNT